MQIIHWFIGLFGGPARNVTIAGFLVGVFILGAGVTPGEWIAEFWLEPPDWITAWWFGPSLIIVGLAIIFGSLRYNQWKNKPIIPREELAEKCDELSKEIIDFLFERKMGEPSFFPEKQEDLSDQTYKRFIERADYSAATRNTYTRKFHAHLHDLYALLKRNGHNPDDGPLFGEDAWADRIAANLTIYASIIREGGTVDDKRK